MARKKRNVYYIVVDGSTFYIQLKKQTGNTICCFVAHLFDEKLKFTM